MKYRWIVLCVAVAATLPLSVTESKYVMEETIGTGRLVVKPKSPEIRLSLSNITGMEFQTYDSSEEYICQVFLNTVAGYILPETIMVITDYEAVYFINTNGESNPEGADFYMEGVDSGTLVLSQKMFTQSPSYIEVFGSGVELVPEVPILPVEPIDPPDAGGSTGGSEGGSTGGSDSGSTGGSEGGSTGDSDSGSTGGSDSGSTGDSDSGSTGGSEGGSTGDSDSGSTGGSEGGSTGGSDSGSTGGSEGGSTGDSDSGSTGGSDSGSTGDSDSGSAGGSDSGSTRGSDSGSASSVNGSSSSSEG